MSASALAKKAIKENEEKPAKESKTPELKVVRDSLPENTGEKPTAAKEEVRGEEKKEGKGEAGKGEAKKEEAKKSSSKDSKKEKKPAPKRKAREKKNAAQKAESKQEAKQGIKPDAKTEDSGNHTSHKSFREFNPWNKILRPDKPIEEYNNKEVGKEGELLASLFLQYKNYEILEMNWTCKFGEVDIVARDGDELVLCEVKTRLCLHDGEAIPELRVHKRKQDKYRKLALCYLMEHPKEDALRFDVMALTITGQRSAKLRHLLGAFSFDL